MTPFTAARWKDSPSVTRSTPTQGSTPAGRSTSTSSAGAFAHATASPEFADPYIDPKTGLLRNLISAANQDELNTKEAELTALAAIELAARPVPVTGDLRQLTAIQGHPFHDVYDWAGELRTVDIRKGTDAAAEFFMPVSRLRTGAGFAFQELADDQQLRGLATDPFVSRLAHHYDQLNDLHPFREGKGRTQRIFWSQIAANAGYELDWRKTTGPINDQASHDAMERRDFSGLRAMLDTITTPSASRGEGDLAARVRLFANLDMPLRGSILADRRAARRACRKDTGNSIVPRTRGGDCSCDGRWIHTRLDAGPKRALADRCVDEGGSDQDFHGQVDRQECGPARLRACDVLTQSVSGVSDVAGLSV